ncbi:hypothetical protein L3Y34_005842 [Caenorhabditis briggsae]|uniref:Uncharacterized protein n=2 Tax=Caenorhabditis briggsae TaxID=6238 RepID=A0AAE8ZW86_CAEBR|nr:hypothetical protein L3Y34_005842 [Caenorhabditis briggsae]
MKKNSKSRKDEDLDMDLIPETGLYTVDGYLFYHTTSKRLTKAQVQRVEGNGINIQSARNFSLNESVQLFKNWKKYCDENNIPVLKALEYMKSRDAHFLKHQEERNFWVKLCHGLPHRSGYCIKTRAIKMMTDNYLKTFDWEASDYAVQIQQRFYKVSALGGKSLEKTQKLLERGYGASHIAEVLKISVSKATNITAKLRLEERREDGEMLKNFFESCLSLGLDVKEIKKFVLGDNEFKLYGLEENVKLDELCFRMKLPVKRCKELLKMVLKTILDKFQKSLNTDKLEAELAWKLAIGEISTTKPPIEEHQIFKALEVFCQQIERDDTATSMKAARKGEKNLKTEGITGFQCDQSSEYQLIHTKIFYEMMMSLEQKFFKDLRHENRCQLKLHCLLWAWKRLEVWEKIHVAKDKNRYEAVLEFELANPLASDLTKNFLKNKKCVKWIMESRITTIKHPIKPRHLLKSAIEAFILYKDRKSSGNFKFPAKLHPLIAITPSDIIQETLSKILDPENSEYLSLKKAKKRVENASGMKILVKLTSNQKAIQMKDSEDVENSEDEEDVDIERLLKYSRKYSREIDEKRKIEMDEILEKADPEKIWLKMSGNSENLEMNEDMMKKKTSLKKIAKKQKKSVRNRSKKLVEASDDSDQDGVICLEDNSEDVKNKDPAKSKNNKRKDPEDFPEDISNSESKKSQKRKRRSTKDVTDSESKFTKTKKKKKTSDDVPTSEDFPGDVADSECEKWIKEESVDVADSEWTKVTKKKKENSEDVPTSGDFPDVENSECEKWKNGDPDDVAGSEWKEATRKKPENSEDVTKTEDVNDPEDNSEDMEVAKSAKSKKKKKKNSGDVKSAKKTPEASSEDVVDAELANLKRKKKNSDDVAEDIPEDVGDSEFRKSKKRKRRSSEDVTVTKTDEINLTEKSSKNSKKSKDRLDDENGRW